MRDENHAISSTYCFFVSKYNEKSHKTRLGSPQWNIREESLFEYMVHRDGTTIKMLESEEAGAHDYLAPKSVSSESALEVETKRLMKTEQKDNDSADRGLKAGHQSMSESSEDDEDVNEDEKVTLDVGEPPEEVMEYAERVLGETAEVKCVTIQELRDMIYETGECTPHRMDDAFLLRFLRARYFDVNRAHRLVVNYYNFKTDHPEIHDDVNPLDLRHIGDDDIITVPPYRTQCGRRMMIYRIGNWDPRKYSMDEIFKATVLVLELGILEPRAQILGGIVIFDLEGLSMAHAWSVTPQVAGMVLSLMVTAFPIKSYAIHILHQSWIFDAIFAVFRPLLNAKMRNKLFFHGDNMESLHEHVAPTSLPKKYGGTRNEFPYHKWIDSLTKNRPIVKEMQQLGYIASDEILHNLD